MLALEPNSDDTNCSRGIPKKVGYGCPPEASRFKPGVSGNPKGRPKGSLNLVSILHKTLREKVVINEHGRRKTVTKLEAAMKQLVNKAATGDLKALRHLADLMRYAEAKEHAGGHSSPDLNDLDYEVMEGILKRLQGQEVEDKEPKETLYDADQHS